MDYTGFFILCGLLACVGIYAFWRDSRPKKQDPEAEAQRAGGPGGPKGPV